MVEIPEEWVDRVHSVLATRAVLTCRADVEAALSALPVAEMVEALEKIRGGRFMEASEMRGIARTVLSRFPSPSTEKART